MSVVVGQRFGMLTITAIEHGTKQQRIRVAVRCDCGTVKTSQLNHLQGGRTVSCGCYGKERRGKGSITHGLRHHPLYGMWCQIKNRCFSPSVKAYERYGGRGITMCKRWKDDFAVFLADVGERPDSTLTIDRIDNDGNYEPGNVRWATRKEQANNRMWRRWKKRPI